MKSQNSSDRSNLTPKASPRISSLQPRGISMRHTPPQAHKNTIPGSPSLTTSNSTIPIPLEEYQLWNQTNSTTPTTTTATPSLSSSSTATTTNTNSPVPTKSAKRPGRNSSSQISSSSSSCCVEPVASPPAVVRPVRFDEFSNPDPRNTPLLSRLLAPGFATSISSSSESAKSSTKPESRLPGLKTHSTQHQQQQQQPAVPKSDYGGSSYLSSTQARTSSEQNMVWSPASTSRSQAMYHYNYNDPKPGSWNRYGDLDVQNLQASMQTSPDSQCWPTVTSVDTSPVPIRRSPSNTFSSETQDDMVSSGDSPCAYPNTNERDLEMFTKDKPSQDFSTNTSGSVANDEDTGSDNHRIVDQVDQTNENSNSETDLTLPADTVRQSTTTCPNMVHRIPHSYVNDSEALAAVEAPFNGDELLDTEQVISEIPYSSEQQQMDEFVPTSNDQMGYNPTIEHHSIANITTTSPSSIHQTKRLESYVNISDAALVNWLVATSNMRSTMLKLPTSISVPPYRITNPELLPGPENGIPAPPPYKLPSDAQMGNDFAYVPPWFPPVGYARPFPNPTGGGGGGADLKFGQPISGPDFPPSNPSFAPRYPHGNPYLYYLNPGSRGPTAHQRYAEDVQNAVKGGGTVAQPSHHPYEGPIPFCYSNMYMLPPFGPWAHQIPNSSTKTSGLGPPPPLSNSHTTDQTFYPHQPSGVVDLLQPTKSDSQTTHRILSDSSPSTHNPTEMDYSILLKENQQLRHLLSEANIRIQYVDELEWHVQQLSALVESMILSHRRQCELDYQLHVCPLLPNQPFTCPPDRPLGPPDSAGLNLFGTIPANPGSLPAMPTCIPLPYLTTSFNSPLRCKPNLEQSSLCPYPTHPPCTNQMLEPGHPHPPAWLLHSEQQQQQQQQQQQIEIPQRTNTSILPRRSLHPHNNTSAWPRTVSLDRAGQMKESFSPTSPYTRHRHNLLVDNSSHSKDCQSNPLHSTPSRRRMAYTDPSQVPRLQLTTISDSDAEPTRKFHMGVQTAPKSQDDLPNKPRTSRPVGINFIVQDAEILDDGAVKHLSPLNELSLVNTCVSPSYQVTASYQVCVMDQTSALPTNSISCASNSQTAAGAKPMSKPTGTPKSRLLTHLDSPGHRQQRSRGDSGPGSKLQPPTIALTSSPSTKPVDQLNPPRKVAKHPSSSTSSSTATSNTEQMSSVELRNVQSNSQTGQTQLLTQLQKDSGVASQLVSPAVIRRPNRPNSEPDYSGSYEGVSPSHSANSRFSEASSLEPDSTLSDAAATSTAPSTTNTHPSCKVHTSLGLVPSTGATSCSGPPSDVQPRSRPLPVTSYLPRFGLTPRTYNSPHLPHKTTHPTCTLSPQFASIFYPSSAHSGEQPNSFNLIQPPEPGKSGLSDQSTSPDAYPKQEDQSLNKSSPTSLHSSSASTSTTIQQQPYPSPQSHRSVLNLKPNHHHLMVTPKPSLQVHFASTSGTPVSRPKESTGIRSPLINSTISPQLLRKHYYYYD